MANGSYWCSSYGSWIRSRKCALVANGLRVDYTKANGKPSSAYVFNGQAWDVTTRELVSLSKTTNGLVEYIAPKEASKPVRQASRPYQNVRLQWPKPYLMLIEIAVVIIGFIWIKLNYT